MIRGAAPARAAQAPNARRVFTVVLFTALGVSLLCALGFWQLERRLWKRDLIQKVETRYYAPPHALADLAAINPAAHEYEHVEVTGRFLEDLDTWVHASTVLGTGYWVLSPLRTSDAHIVLINRGFVPLDTPRPGVEPDGRGVLIGVLRASEPGSAWPRRNEPGEDRWYSRDVAAIARRRGLQAVAPFFIDADAATADLTGTHDAVPMAKATTGGVRPVGGLTVVHFRDAHLPYALTWFTLALMMACAGGFVLRGELRGPPRQV